MNPKNKTLTIADVEAALLMSYQVPVSNFRINELLEITTSHYLHAHKNIVLVHSSKINDESYPPELIRFPDSLTRVLSTNVDINSVRLNPSMDVQTSYQNIGKTIDALNIDYNKVYALNQSDYSSFSDLMDSVTDLIHQNPEQRKFIYVQTDEPIIFNRGFLTKESKPIAKMIKNTASKGILAMLTTTPQETHSSSEAYKKLMPFLVLAPILNDENIRRDNFILDADTPTKTSTTQKDNYVIKIIHLKNYQIQNG